MHLFTNSLKLNLASNRYDSMPMTPAGKKSFLEPHSRRFLHHLIGGSAFSAVAERKFGNPNFVNNIKPSSHSYEKYLAVDVNKEICDILPLVGEINSSQQPNKHLPDSDSETTATQSNIMCSNSRKRNIKNKNPRKSNKNKVPEKHNTNRQLISELMEIDNVEMPDCAISINDSDVKDSGRTVCTKLVDLLNLTRSSPQDIPILDICMQSNMLPISFRISPPNFCTDLRQRQISITESEDSFIVFDEQCNFSDDILSSESDNDSEDNSDSPSSVIACKRVRFAEEKELCQIYPMVKWAFAYQEARRGPWEVYARDRSRFKNKIDKIEPTLSKILEADHRNKVYEDRFAED